MAPMKLQQPSGANNNGGNEGGEVSEGNGSGAESDRSNTDNENNGRDNNNGGHHTPHHPHHQQQQHSHQSSHQQHGGGSSSRGGPAASTPSHPTIAMDTSDEEPDSDDSSEMDEGVCESRRVELIQHVQDLESQFGHLREQLYRERMAQVEIQLSEVRTGRSPDYLGPLHQLQENMRIRTEVAGILRKFRLDNIKNQFEAEEQAALQNFESEKLLAMDYYYGELMDTIRKLEEDRHNSEITWGEGGEWCSRSRSRSRRKAVTVSGPYIVYMLRPQDIMEDWTAIRKALKRTV